MSSDEQSKDVSELSIEETNKLRIKLGLKPLELNSGSSSSQIKSEDEEKSYEKRGEVFIQTSSLADKIEADKLREKFVTQREKRLQAEKLKSIKTIADEIDDDDLDPYAWVNKSRENDTLKNSKLEEEAKKKLEKKLQREKEVVEKQRVYNEAHVKGLKVNHSLDKFAESRSVILTLRDREILDEQGEDELENVNLKDDEKASENVFNKKHGANDYNPYETQESLLSKYDDKAAESFRIGGALASSMTPGQSAEIPSDSKVSLNTLQIKFASEFYTPQEMEAKFKKRKKKVTKKGSIRTTMSETVLEESTPSTDRDDKASKPKRKKQEKSDLIVQEESAKASSGLTSVRTDDTELEESMDQDLDNYFPGVVDDEAETELQEALEKVRRRKQPVVPSITDLLSTMPPPEPFDDSTADLPSTSSAIILDSTAEFCRALGETSTQFKNEPNDPAARASRSEEESEMMEISEKRSQDEEEEEEAEEEYYSSRKSRKGRSRPEDQREDTRPSKDKWTEVKVEKDESTLYEKLKSQPILEEEPDVSLGVASALQLAYQKGYLDKEAKKSASAPMKHPELMAKGYSIEEKFRDDDRRGHRGENRGYSAPGSASEFKEKANYKPDVKLEYVDDNGRLMNQKEAFRVLSHKFHGKGPGKNKVDKRMKKLEQESKLRQMSCIDTPLNTVHKLQEKQKELQLPYVVLSGSGSSLVKK